MENLIITKASEVAVKEVEWLWYPYIPYGKVTVLQGDSGDGIDSNGDITVSGGEMYISGETTEVTMDSLIYGEGFGMGSAPRIAATNKIKPSAR